ncbi:transmembrane protein 179B [Elysia marginata]|uniref:Transmembrane protein 179B n=1 Tax=Elysia marginata TaxID=1093978 RepID=A0AAV4HST9_9GAST|nr:transmembrane protein 179B [Elysia marginata]
MASDDTAPAFYPEWAKKSKQITIAGMICCGVLIILCLLIFIPLAVTKYEAGGSCFLYADTFGFGASSVCDYCIAIAVVLLILCAGRLGLLVYKFLEKPEHPVIEKASKWFSLYGVHLVIVLIDVALLVLLLVVACLVSVGTAHLCNSLFGSRSKCSDGNGVILPDESVSRSFHTSLSISETAAWIGFLFWLLVVIFEVYVAWKKDTLQPITSRMANLKGGDKGGSSAV